MKNDIYVKHFDYDMECRRVDAPKENVSHWLERQAVREANRKTGGDWVVFKTKMEKRDYGSYIYMVALKPFLA